MKTVIVIPAYNEEENVASVVKRAKRYGTVIVVNDASKDSTEKLAKNAGAKVINHAVNQGLGGALRTGFREALKITSNPNDIIITLDADGQHDPDDIPKFIEAIHAGNDFVLGARNLRKYPLMKKIGNFCLNILTNIVTNTWLKDTESGYRAFTRISLSRMVLKSSRYEIAAEIISEVGRLNLKAVNIPVKSPVYVKGVKVSDGIKNLLYILKKSR